MPPRSKASPGEVSLTKNDLVVLIIGPTGAGKSTFVKYASQRNDVKVGHRLSSCTNDISFFKAEHLIGGQPVVFVDTPGFDDTSGRDTIILTEIAEFLARIYKRNIDLAALIYMHRICDNRIGNTALSNLRMFSNLCGETVVSTVTFVTTMWNQVTEQVGSRREVELKGLDTPVLARATYRRFDGTAKSALEITRTIVQNAPIPALQIQREMVDEKKTVGETKAGRQQKAKQKERSLCLIV